MAKLLNNKKIILGISGSIAAYKSAFLCRLLIKQGAEVRVIMTKAAAAFISPLTLSTLSKHDVHVDLFAEGTWHNHVELGLWADAMIIVPATANTMAKMANGIADNMLICTYLSAKCPVHIAPAMDLDMWKHGSTKMNIKKLESYGNVIIPVGNGELASGLVGDGRVAEPEFIVDHLIQHLTSSQDMSGKKVLITAGPTYEHLDPVRFIGNPSTGKMGVAIANECARRGAEVRLILGPTKEHELNHSISVTRVRSAEEMYKAAKSNHDQSDAVIFTAAVADFTPAQKAEQKIKKTENTFALNLVRTKDIAFELGQQKQKQIHIGFALETNDEEFNAQKKLKKKNFDFIVLNSLNDRGAGFGHDTNKVKLIDHQGIEDLPLKSKKEVAVEIVNKLVKTL